MERSIKSNQLKMRDLQFEIAGTLATPVASGFDKNQISSVVDNGVGDYTVIFKRPFGKTNTNLPKGFVQCLTAGTIGYITSSAYDRITVNTFDAATGAVATDADFSLLVRGCDHRFNY